MRCGALAGDRRCELEEGHPKPHKFPELTPNQRLRVYLDSIHDHVMDVVSEMELVYAWLEDAESRDNPSVGDPESR